MTARFGACLTMIHGVSLTLCGAGTTYVRANSAESIGELGTAHHFADGEGAEIRTTPVQRDASGHHGHVSFVEALRRAVFTSNGTRAACLNAGLIQFVRHNRTVSERPHLEVPSRVMRKSSIFSARFRRGHVYSYSRRRSVSDIRFNLMTRLGVLIF
jgi:hypothetical protein